MNRKTDILIHFTHASSMMASSPIRLQSQTNGMISDARQKPGLKRGRL
jgi:hypothetical protein